MPGVPRPPSTTAPAPLPTFGGAAVTAAPTVAARAAQPTMLLPDLSVDVSPENASTLMQSAQDWSAGNYGRSIGEAVRGLGGIGWNAGARVLAPVGTAGHGVVNFGKGLVNYQDPSTAPSTPAGVGGAPGQTATESASAPAAQDSPAMQHFHALMQMTQGMTKRQIAEYAKTYPRVMPIDPKTLATAQYFNQANEVYAQKRDALAKSGLTGKDLATAVDALDQEHMRNMALVLSPQNYLFAGMPPAQ